MSQKKQTRWKSSKNEFRLYESTPNLESTTVNVSYISSVSMSIDPSEENTIQRNRLRPPMFFIGSDEKNLSSNPLRRGVSLNLERPSQKANCLGLANSETNLRTQNDAEHDNTSASMGLKTARYSAPALVAPAPEHLAISLLQLGCPLVSMPRPRGGLLVENLPQSSDSDESVSSHPVQHHQLGQTQVEGYGIPKVQISTPANGSEASSINGSAGSIGARSAPSTPIQPPAGCGQQSPQDKNPVSGPQLSIGSPLSHQVPVRSPSHSGLQKCHDNQLSKPLSRSTPSITVGGVTTSATISRSSTRSSPTSTSSARQKKFHRHFSQVAPDERVLNYYSCALVGDILLQGHLYITANYFAFYSNVFGYITKLLIPTTSVRKISKEKTARIIPNAIAIVTEEDRHVFCSLLSRDSTFKLMKQVWDVALEGRQAADDLPLPVEVKLLAPAALLVDDSEINAEEDDSSMSESGTDLTSRPPTICTDTDVMTPSIPRPISAIPRLDHPLAPKTVSSSKIGIRSLMRHHLRPGIMIAVLVALLAALYISAALMMLRIDKLHTAYLNHPLASPEKFTQDRLMHYLNSNLDQIMKVRQSLQTLSQQFVAMSQESEAHHTVSRGGPTKAEDTQS